MRSRKTFAVLAIVGAVLCWSSVPLFLKYFSKGFDAWTVNGARYGVALLLVLPMVFFRSKQTKQTPCGRSIWVAALIPAAVNIVGQIGWAFAPYFLNAGVMGFGVRAAFFFTLLGSAWLIPGERYIFRMRPFWCGMCLCVAGSALLYCGAMGKGGTSLPGALILVATAAVWGFYGVTVRRFMAGYSRVRGFGVVALYTTPVLVVLMFLLGDYSQLATCGALPLMLLFASAAVGIVCAHILMYYAVHEIGAIISSGVEFVAPFITVTGAYLLFGETMTVAQWGGGLAVIAGSILMLRLLRNRPGDPGIKSQDPGVSDCGDSPLLVK